jgi:hypothetical protein
MMRMKILHECPRNIPGMDMPVYTNDKGRDKTWYINAHIVFYCPYCGIDLKDIVTTEST